MLNSTVGVPNVIWAADFAKRDIAQCEWRAKYPFRKGYCHAQWRSVRFSTNIVGDTRLLICPSPIAITGSVAVRSWSMRLFVLANCSDALCWCVIGRDTTTTWQKFARASCSASLKSIWSWATRWPRISTAWHPVRRSSLAFTSSVQKIDCASKLACNCRFASRVPVVHSTCVD